MYADSKETFVLPLFVACLADDTLVVL